MLLFLMRKAFTLMFPVLLLTVLSVGLVFPALATKGSYPGINGKIAFSDRESSPDDDEIFVMDNDGTNIEQLTFNDVYDRDPCWSPDGTKIAFHSGSPSEIWVMDADGSNLRQLTTPPDGYRDIDPAWSPDGEKIAFTIQPTSSGVSRIYVIDANGPAGVGTLLIDVTNARHPSWSPDGSEISYNYQGIIYVADASTGTLKRTLGEGYQSCWSPDGTKIVFGYNDEIWVMDAADGSNRNQLSNPTGNYEDDQPNWSPDGTKIVFQREEDSIWIMDADGSNEYDLTPTMPGASAPDYQRPLPTIYVDAPSTVTVSTEFDITIGIRDIPDGYGITAIDLLAEWDPNDLEYIESEFLGDSRGWTGDSGFPDAWGGDASGTLWTEDAAWFRIRFHCLREGPATITVSSPLGIDLSQGVDGPDIMFPQPVTVTVNQVEPAPEVAPVGGIVTPVYKTEVLTPYLALAGLIITVSTFYVIKKRRD